MIHKRDHIYANLICIYIISNSTKKYAEANQLVTKNMNEDEIDNIRILSDINFDRLEIPFHFWNGTGMTLNFKVLSCPISNSSTSKIISKKHMLEAHKMLNTDKLLVSIPLHDVIFVCKKDLSEEDFKMFFAIHYYALSNNKNQSNILCEDSFIVKNGEIEGAFEYPDISEELLKKN